MKDKKEELLSDDKEFVRFFCLSYFSNINSKLINMPSNLSTETDNRWSIWLDSRQC